MNLPNGHVLQNGKYQITHVIGQGGFGITYKGIWFTEVKGALGTVKTEVPICIKEYFFKDYCYRETNSFTVKAHSETGRALFDKFKEKLIKEAKILSEVHHPYIVNVLEVFEENGTAYIAMEHISGCSLKYMMDKEGKLPEDKVLRYVRQIGEALQFVHEKSILHLDIKPSNILIDPNGKARLIDFGVSKRYDIEQQETSTTMLTLSKGFASIEQYDNEGTLNFSPCPDIYSLGATMYNLLTGKIPTESILRATRPLLKPADLTSEITQKTEDAIIKAMQIIPADRFQTVSEMLDALDLPPANEEDIKNCLSEPGISNGEETTVLYGSGQQQSADDDRTIINRTESIVPEHPKRNKKGILVSVVLVVFACVGSAVAFLVQGNKQPLSDTASVTAVLPPPEDPIKGDSLVQDEEKKIDVAVQSEKKPEVISENTAPAKKKEPVVKETVTKPSVAEAAPPTIKPVADIDAEYASLIASGKAKMEGADFVNARKDLTKAKETKLTEEVVRLLITCDSKEGEKLLADRKAQYVEMMTLGKYKIVRKKSTGKYGAIDANAEEYIPCKYLIVGRAENGRAFEREDGLFDIYNTDGVLVSKGLTYY